MKNKRRLIDWTLRQKIILHVMVIGLISVLLLTLMYLTSQRTFMRELNRERSELISSMIECNVIHQMNQNQADNVPYIIGRLVGSIRIQTIRVLDTAGRIKSSSLPSEMGGAVSEETAEFIRNHLKWWEESEPKTVKSVNPDISYMAIKNRPECFSCHAPEIKLNGILEVTIDTRETQRHIRANQLRGFLIAVVLLSVLIYIIIRLFEKIINRPLSQLKDEMKKLEAGDLSAYLEPRKMDEIGDLTQSFNRMADKVRQADEKIKSLHEQEMLRAGHLASIGELAAGLAHEIKNPIAGVKGALEILEEQTPDADLRKEIFQEMIRQVDGIHHIVQDLLHYARPKQMDPRLLDPLPAVESALTIARAQTKKKYIRFSIKTTGEKRPVWMDENKIQEVVLNLLLNAIDAIEEEGRVTITAGFSDPLRFKLAVADTGGGIRPERIPDLFKPFFTTRKGGTGLGLSICKRIVEEHGGTIQVSSVVDEGTTFSFHLPDKAGTS
ncbi:MAG: HAMP domain-containing protein [Acidobacteria bacterium]|nr:HAMP domain-containing protein [Acidobacteriota bacterium]MBU1339005.1 HAMP domain-containing protein [Acidobacteriota bacterium]MBU1473601.1 HAMP domain-containing protein [Acidobacteriota bacterium]MBU2439161.1 HAMP domain-containing protein [Acidobacteriota bacterium]